MTLLRDLRRRGISFTVDPPEQRQAVDAIKKPMDVTFLEQMLRRSGGFLAIVPDRRSALSQESWSPYQIFEYELAVRSGKPRLIVAEKDIDAEPLVQADRNRLLYFDRTTGGLTASTRVSNEQIKEFVALAKAHAPPAESQRPRAIFLPDSPDNPYAELRSAIEAQGIKRLHTFRLEPMHNSPRSADLLGSLESVNVLIADLRPSITPPHVWGYVHARGIPTNNPDLFRS